MSFHKNKQELLDVYIKIMDEKQNTSDIVKKSNYVVEQPIEYTNNEHVYTKSHFFNDYLMKPKEISSKVYDDIIEEIKLKNIKDWKELNINIIRQILRKLKLGIYHDFANEIINHLSTYNFSS
jgi:hypothetical protein